MSDKLLDLRECKLQGSDLSGKTLSGALLLGADLSGSNLREAVFSKAGPRPCNKCTFFAFHMFHDCSRGAALSTGLRSQHQLLRCGRPRPEHAGSGHSVFVAKFMISVLVYQTPAATQAEDRDLALQALT